ncbi:TPA: hypothetical protein ACH3X3_002479 [Trebouxia sp. C0006]
MGLNGRLYHAPLDHSITKRLSRRQPHSPSLQQITGHPEDQPQRSKYDGCKIIAPPGTPPPPPTSRGEMPAVG